MNNIFTRTELNPIKLEEMLEELENTVELHSISVRYRGETVLEGAWSPIFHILKSKNRVQRIC